MTGPDAPPLRAAERSAVVAAVAAGVVLRFVTTSHLWLDEALSVDIARLPLGDIPEALRHDGHPPLYYLLLHGWMAVAGEGDVAVRALSGVLAVAALPLAWVAGRRVGGAAGGWWALAVFALCPFLLRYGTEARMYSLVVLLVLGGWLLVRRALEEPTPARLLPVTVVAGLLLLTHYWGLWLLAATGLVLLALARREAAARRVVVALALGAVLLVPWLPSMLDQAAHTGTPWADPARPTTIVTTTVGDVGGGDYAEATLLGWALVGLALVGFAGRTTSARTLELDVRGVPGLRAEAAVVGLTIAIASVAGYASRTTFATRYAAVFLPLVLLLAAAGLARLPGRPARAAALAAVLLLGAVGGGHDVVTDRTQSGVVAAAIRAGSATGDVVAICPDQLGPSVHRLLPPSLLQVTYPLFGDPALVDWRDYADRNAAADPVAFARGVAERAGGAASVWLVLSGSYKTLAGQCEAVQAGLSERYGAPEVVVVEDGDAYFEHAALVRWQVPGRPGG